MFVSKKKYNQVLELAVMNRNELDEAYALLEKLQSKLIASGSAKKATAKKTVAKKKSTTKPAKKKASK